MNFLRKHWFDLAGIGVILAAAYLILAWQELSTYRQIMWVSLITLFLHEIEEYRVIGTFPGMFNKVMFKSDIPDRYPINMNTSLVVNVPIAWSIYLLAALVGENAVWLGMASLLISVGNIVIHVFILNIKVKRLFKRGNVDQYRALHSGLGILLLLYRGVRSGKAHGLSHRPSPWSHFLHFWRFDACTVDERPEQPLSFSCALFIA